MTDTASHPTTTGRSHPSAILAIILVSYFMILLDNSVIFTGLPSIRAAMHLSPAGLSWVQDAYTLVFGGLLLLGARAATSSAGGGCSSSGWRCSRAASLLIGPGAHRRLWLIAARALQGVGAAIVAPTSLSLLTASFPKGVSAPVPSPGTARRPASAPAWAWSSAVRSPAGLLAGRLLCQRADRHRDDRARPALPPRDAAPERPVRPGRRAGATLGMSALVFGIVESAEVGWAAPRTSRRSSSASCCSPCSWSTRPARPSRSCRCGSSPAASAPAPTLARLLYLGAMIGFFFFTTQFLQGVLGFTAAAGRRGVPADDASSTSSSPWPSRG